MSQIHSFHNYRLQELAWPQVEAYLQKSRRILLPVGSTEQHGLNGLLGIDFLSAESIAQAVALETQTLVAPALPFGMAVHHMGFPGTMTLSPLTYTQVITELLEALKNHGFQEIILINGHGGNSAPITTAFCQAKQKAERLNLKVINWWTLPGIAAYEKMHFGDKSGFHATCGELSATMYTHPKAYQAMRQDFEFNETPVRTHWPMSPVEYRENFPQGHMGSDPKLANAVHGKVVFEIAVKEISQMIARTLS